MWHARPRKAMPILLLVGLLTLELGWRAHPPDGDQANPTTVNEEQANDGSVKVGEPESRPAFRGRSAATIFG